MNLRNSSQDSRTVFLGTFDKNTRSGNENYNTHSALCNQGIDSFICTYYPCMEFKCWALDLRCVIHARHSRLGLRPALRSIQDIPWPDPFNLRFPCKAFQGPIPSTCAIQGIPEPDPLTCTIHAKHSSEDPFDLHRLRPSGA